MKDKEMLIMFPFLISVGLAFQKQEKLPLDWHFKNKKNYHLVIRYYLFTTNGLFCYLQYLQEHRPLFSMSKT